MRKLARIFQSHCKDNFNFDKVEKFILDKGLLYFNLSKDNYGYNDNIPTSVKKSFDEAKNIQQFLAKLLRFSYTYYSFNEKNIIECRSKSSRSITDIYRLTKYYKPNYKLIDVYNGLLNLISSSYAYSWICFDIDKRVYGFQQVYDEKVQTFNCFEHDEYGFDFHKYQFKENSKRYPFGFRNTGMLSSRHYKITNPININV